MKDTGKLCRIALPLAFAAAMAAAPLSAAENLSEYEYITDIGEPLVPEADAPDETRQSDVPTAESVSGEETASRENLSDEEASVTALPDETMPDETLPDETLPEETLPEETGIMIEISDAAEETVTILPAALTVPYAEIPEEAYPLHIRYQHLLVSSPGGINLLLPGYGLATLVELPQPQKAPFMLRRSLEEMVGSFDGTWSVYVEDLHTGETILINDVVMPSASIMKLFILGCTYDAIDRGELERSSELVAQFSGMIKASSNEDANKVIYKLGGGDYARGIARINAYIEENGYSDKTKAYNPFQNSSLVLDDKHANTTSAADCGLLLSRIYHREFGRRRICNEVEELLLSQGTRYKIPKAIPDGSLVGNKTGETDTVENDVAIVYTPAGDYILCVFSTDWKDKKLAQSRITQVSAEVYAYFTDPSYGID